MKKLQPYHYAWLASHPNRNTDWLRFMLKAGFDIHHMDGDHDNNDAANLVLIEHTDHMRLHGMTGPGRVKMQHVVQAAKQARRKVFLAEGKLAYEVAASITEDCGSQFGFWRKVASIAKMKHGPHAVARAKIWAEENNLEWPLTTYATRHNKSDVIKRGLVS